MPLADGLRTLDEILASSPVDALTTRQVLAGLALTGALAIRVLQAGRPASAAAAAIDLARVSDKLDQARRADYFTILGVARGCTPHDVRDAADRLLAEFDPRRFTAAPTTPGRAARRDPQRAPGRPRRARGRPAPARRTWPALGDRWLRPARARAGGGAPAVRGSRCAAAPSPLHCESGRRCSNGSRNRHLARSRS